MQTYPFFAAALVLIAAPALADPATTSAPTAVGPCAGVFLSAAALSDYRFDGFSESNRAPTWQVTGYCYRNDGYFAGVTATGIDFEDTPRTPAEMDWYAGRQIQWRDLKVTADLLYASFPDKRAPGPSYDLVEPQIEVSRTIKRLTLSGLAGWEADTSGGGTEWHVKASAAYALTPWLTASAHAGRFFATTGIDHPHNHWDVGATATWRRLSLDARYGGTDQAPAQCFYTRWCEPGASVSLTWRVLP
jgi:uncharacterized protein (TIGR02001 family)